MKIYGKLLAICAISPVSAFVVNKSRFHKQTSLYISDKSTQAGTYESKAYQTLKETLTKGKNLSGLKVGSLGRVTGIVTEGSEAYANKGQQIWDSAQKTTVQGASLKTFSFPNPLVERVKVVLRSNGRPLNADVDLWHGPDNTPAKMRVYLEDGSERPFMASIETPEGSNTVAVRNLAGLEFPLDAAVLASINEESPLATPTESDVTVQGGALKTFPFDPLVQSVQVLLKTDGRPLNARIELLQGPNNNKQVVEIYTENGTVRPFFMILETPGSGNVVRVLNTAPVEFPMTASVEPYDVGIDESVSFDAVISGDGDW